MLSQVERKNLTKLLQRYSFEHLRPPPQVFEITIPQNQHFFVTEKDKRRRIFYKVQYEEKQYEAIEQLKISLKEKQINHWFGDQILLKHIYAAKWSISKAADRIEKLLAFHIDPQIIKFNQQTIKRLQTGCVYSFGHDKGMRPIIIMRVDKFDLKQPIQVSLNTYYYLMLVILGYKMVPYHAEKYNLIMDFNHISFADIPYGYLYDALEKINNYYCGNSEKTFLFNSQGIKNIWKMVSFFLPESQKKRIIFVDKGEQEKILQYISQYELQRRYGGKLNNLTSFWPPKNTNQSFDMDLNSKVEESFYSVANDEEYFEISMEDHTFCGNPKCDCSIY